MTSSSKIHLMAGSLVALLAGVLFGVTLAPAGAVTPAYYAVSQAVFVCFVCYLLLPSAGTLPGILVNSAIGVALFAALCQMPMAHGIPASVLLQLCSMIFCVSLLLWNLTRLLEGIFSDKSNIRATTLLLATIATSTPVWLGPVMDVYQPRETVINGVVSITPLTHFSVAAEYDYLRSEWLYKNSSFGSLPFSYPEFGRTILYYILFVFFIELIIRGVSQRLRNANRPS